MALMILPAGTARSAALRKPMNSSLALHAAADHDVFQHIQCREQRRGAMALVVVLVWTAARRHRRARMRSLLISDKGGRPWIMLAESGWIRRSMFSSFME